jgi:DNA repair protein SbcC/Rad50
MVSREALLHALGGRVRNEDLAETSHGIFRAAVQYNSKPYRVHFFDLNKPFLKPGFDLEEYQRSLLAEDYYAHPGALQWNYYLDFLVDDEDLENGDVKAQKNQIEANHVFARKAVASLSQVRRSFAVPTQLSTEAPRDVRDVWLELLSPHGLEDVLDQEVALQSVVDSYVTAGAIEPKQGKPRRYKAVGTVDRFGRLELVQYRRFPEKRDFQFSAVNLIHGANAAGKTSLLEAIELMLCGRTRRNPQVSEPFKFRAEINGALNTVLPLDDLEYRDRDFSWYGSRFNTGAELANSFARFNFFDSDAAARFAEEIDPTTRYKALEGGSKGGSFERAMKGIVFGPDAFGLEQRVEKILDKFQAQARLVLESKLQANAEMATLNERLTALRALDATSISLVLIYDRLKDVGFSDSVRAMSGAEIARSIAEVKDLADVLIEQAKGVGEVTLRKLEERLASLSAAQASIVIVEARLSDLNGARSRVLEETAGHELRAQTFSRANQYQIDEAWDLLGSQSISELKRRVNVLQIAANEYSVNTVPNVDIEASVSHLLAEVTARLTTLKVRQDEQKRALEEVGNSYERSRVLVQAIRSQSVELLSLQPALARCPVCNVDHGAQLSEIVHSASQGADGSAQELANRMQNLFALSNEVATAQATLDGLNRLRMSAARLGLDVDDMNVVKAVGEIEGALAEQEELRSKVKMHEERMATLEGRGYSRLEARQLLEAMGISSADTKATIASALKRGEALLKNTLEQLKERVRNLDDEIAKAIKERENLLEGTRLGAGEHSKSALDVELHSVSRAINSVAAIRAFVPTITEVDNLVSFRAKLGELDTLVGKRLTLETTATEIRDVESRLLKLQTSVTNLVSREGRAVAAIGTLQNLLAQEGLNGRLDNFLKQNGAAVKEAFLRIHSPREFVDVRFTKDDVRLIRAGNEEAKATQLSTGQRAALALSVFLTMNSLLRKGPNFILLDDPLVHVDDLNLLSFLDLLRDSALIGSRQIFFATANARVAQLFKRKFAFLESQFYECPLVRTEVAP